MKAGDRARKLALQPQPSTCIYTTERFEKEDAMNKDILNYYLAVLADLESERDNLNLMIEGTKARIKSMGGTLDAAPATLIQPKATRRKSVAKTPPPLNISTASHLPYAGLTIFDAARKYLETTREPQSGGQIWEALTRGGLPNIHYNAVYTALWRKRAPIGDFVKEGNGQNARWSLTDTNQHQSKTPSVTSQTRSRGGVTNLDRCEEFLNDAGKPLHLEVLVSKLADAGITTKAVNLSSPLKRDASNRFENLGNNTWALTKWPENIKAPYRKGNKREATLPL